MGTTGDVALSQCENVRANLRRKNDVRLVDSVRVRRQLELVGVNAGLLDPKVVQAKTEEHCSCPARTAPQPAQRTAKSAPGEPEGGGCT